jgi:D-alanyl-D-alanine carboxypeptidase
MLTNRQSCGKRGVTKVGCDPSGESVIMRTTKRHLRQARPITARGESPRPPARRSLRAFSAATGLALVLSLSPRLTQAPTQADEPTGSIGDATTRASQPLSPVAGVAPQLESTLPPRRAGRPSAGASPVGEATANARTAAQFQAALDAARYAAGAYGVTFAAVRDGQVVWAGSSGVARDGRTRLATNSPMVIGSVTKTFVSAAILQLVDEGRIGLDDPVRDHLPELRKVSREITIRQLLDHTSGLADVFNDTTRRGLEEHPERAWTSREVLATLHAPWYRPGEGWAYANTNYHLLGLVVERVTGTTLEQELARRFFDPYDLAATRMLSPDDPTSPLAPAWTTIFWGSGAMVSSASDLARWGDALYDDDVPSRAVLETDTGRAMFTFNRDDYGLGVKRFEELEPRAGYGHTGLLNTYTTLLLHLPKEDVTIAILVNRTNVDLLGMLRERPPFGEPSLLRLAIDS